MMNNEQAIKILTGEILCIKTVDACDRDCKSCPFMPNVEDALKAYETAIDALKRADK